MNKTIRRSSSDWGNSFPLYTSLKQHALILSPSLALSLALEMKATLVEGAWLLADRRGHNRRQSLLVLQPLSQREEEARQEEGKPTGTRWEGIGWRLSSSAVGAEAGVGQDESRGERPTQCKPQPHTRNENNLNNKKQTKRCCFIISQVNSKYTINQYPTRVGIYLERAITK